MCFSDQNPTITACFLGMFLSLLTSVNLYMHFFKKLHLLEFSEFFDNFGLSECLLLVYLMMVSNFSVLLALKPDNHSLLVQYVNELVWKCEFEYTIFQIAIAPRVSSLFSRLTVEMNSPDNFLSGGHLPFFVIPRRCGVMFSQSLQTVLCSAPVISDTAFDLLLGLLDPVGCC